MATDKVVLGDCTLYLGDCLDVMKDMPDKSVDAVITDPPYGLDIMHAGGRSEKHGWRWKGYKDECEWDLHIPDKKYFDEMIRIGKVQILWGGNYFTDYLLPSKQWLIWDKGQRNFSLADGELAWSSLDKAVRIFSYARASMLKENGLHPTQKPIALMKWCIEIASEDGDTILDSFMGSGTTGVACVQTGRKFIGIEIDPKYFEIAVKRIKDAQQQMRLPI